MANRDGTVQDYENFDAEHDAQVLRKAMKGFGTDEKAIIAILAYRSLEQRLQIETTYKSTLGRDLISDLKSELSGKLEDVIMAVMTPHFDFLAQQIHKAMSGVGTNEKAMAEIIVPCTHYAEEINSLKESYETKYGKSLEDAVMSETSGHFKKLLVALLQGMRDQSEDVDDVLVQEDVQALYDAGEGQWGTDESKFLQILANRGTRHLQTVFDEYENQYSRSIDTAIEKEMSGDTEMGFLAVVKCMRNTPAFFSERLYKAMKGAGTDDQTLIRIVATRSEIDLVLIKEEFLQSYGRTLQHCIAGETSGDYKKFLLAMVRD